MNTKTTQTGVEEEMTFRKKLITVVVTIAFLISAGFLFGLGLNAADKLFNDRGFDWNCDGELHWLRGHGEKYDSLTCVTGK